MELPPPVIFVVPAESDKAPCWHVDKSHTVPTCDFKSALLTLTSKSLQEGNVTKPSAVSNVMTCSNRMPSGCQ